MTAVVAAPKSISRLRLPLRRCRRTIYRSHARRPRLSRAARRQKTAVGLVEAVRGVLWARSRRPEEVHYLVALAHERFQPDDLLRQAVEAEAAGFDGVCCSDHLEPWWAPDAPTPAACGNAWVWLGAVAQATSRVELGTAVTGLVHRYNPVVLAQQVATLERLAPGRAFLGVGTSEAMNEIPAGLDWPSPGEQLRRAEEALTIVTRLLDGETVDFDGEFFRARRARLYVKLERRPPVFMSAFHEGAAELAGRLADGVWTLGDPRKAAPVIAAYRRGCERSGREPGEIVIQTLASWAPDDDAALAGAREWKGTLVDEHYTDAVADPAEVGRNGEDEVSDTKFKAMTIVSSDPDTHVKRIRMLERLGATAVCVMNISGADASGMLRTYGEHVLPALRDR
jgi:coenzyme F420-dependent glucose-6-phosphate dehydrogenase